MKRLRLRDRGTSLVEVMIAASLLAIVLLVFLSIMFSSSQLSAGARETAIAASILQSYAEDLFAADYTTFWKTYFGNSGKDDNGNACQEGLYYRLTSKGLQKGTQDEWNDFEYSLTTHSRLTWIDAGTKVRKSESVSVIMLTTSDRADSDTDWTKHAWVDFKLKVTWVDGRGKSREESMISRRSK